jgi:predicted methyltransferase
MPSPFREQRMHPLWIVPIALIAAGSAQAADQAPAGPALQQVIQGPHRSKAFSDRDVSRHPQLELEFCGVAPTSTIVEIWPGGGYWTEILAPYLRDKGTYYAAAPPKAAANGSLDKFRQKIEADTTLYGKTTVTEFGKDHYDIAPASSADVVVTFRNLHNWMTGGYADESLAAFFKALKPGGLLCIEDHRGRDDVPQDPTAATGYVRQDYAVALAKKAGFEFVGASEINANPRDTKDWPKGVWTLPPTFALGDQDRDKYAAIGEADNFVLKFRKPGT